jgi:hypothetical protein
MSVDEFELVLRARIKAQAAELDSSARPAPPLRVLLGSPAAKAGGLATRRLRFGLGMAVALALALGLICGGLLIEARPQVEPLATVTPSPSPPLASPSPSLASPPSPRASPTPSLSWPSASLALMSERSPAQ